jgi:hypothetical protein
LALNIVFDRPDASLDAIENLLGQNVTLRNCAIQGSFDQSLGVSAMPFVSGPTRRKQLIEHVGKLARSAAGISAMARLELVADHGRVYFFLTSPVFPPVLRLSYFRYLLAHSTSRKKRDTATKPASPLRRTAGIRKGSYGRSQLLCALR